MASQRCQHMHIIPILFYQVLVNCWLPLGANISCHFVFFTEYSVNIVGFPEVPTFHTNSFFYRVLGKIVGWVPSRIKFTDCKVQFYKHYCDLLLSLFWWPLILTSPFGLEPFDGCVVCKSTGLVGPLNSRCSAVQVLDAATQIFADWLLLQKPKVHLEACSKHTLPGNSVPSPNKRDVKIQHSEKPGDHERVRDPTGASFSLNCKTQKCRTAQRRCDNCFLMFAMHIHVNMAIMNRKFELLYACMVMNACRYANGTDYRVYLKFINTYKDTVPNLNNLVKQWRFREFKPFQICKAKQQ